MKGLLTGVTLLILGDSHVTFQDSLLSVLPEAYEQLGAKVVTYGVCSSTPKEWLKGPEDEGCGGVIREGTAAIKKPFETPFPFPGINSLITQWQPTAIILVYGDTLGAYSTDPLPGEWIESQITPLTTAITGKATCLWVGPTWGTFNPRYGKSDDKTLRVTRFLSTHTQPCTYIDSTTLMTKGKVKTVDGLHLTTEGYKTWGAGIVNATLPVLTKQNKS